MRVAVILALLPLARSTSEEFAEASNEGECALLQSSAVRTRAFNAAEMTEMSTEHLELRARLAGMSASNLTSHTVCDLETLEHELQGTKIGRETMNLVMEQKQSETSASKLYLNCFVTPHAAPIFITYILKSYSCSYSSMPQAISAPAILRAVLGEVKLVQR
eukprot:3739326-Amphidinium_carterae.1